MANTNDTIKLYTVSEVADMLRVQPQTVRRRIRLKAMNAIKLGGANGWLIPDAELQRLAHEGQNA